MMKAVVPEIAWHNKSPVFSIDIQSTYNKGFYRAATGGGDSHIVVRSLKKILSLIFYYYFLKNLYFF